MSWPLSRTRRDWSIWRRVVRLDEGKRVMRASRIVWGTRRVVYAGKGSCCDGLGQAVKSVLKRKLWRQCHATNFGNGSGAGDGDAGSGRAGRAGAGCDSDRALWIADGIGGDVW